MCLRLKQNLKIEADMVVSECFVCYHIFAYYILCEYMYFLHFISSGEEGELT